MFNVRYFGSTGEELSTRLARSYEVLPEGALPGAEVEVKVWDQLDKTVPPVETWTGIRGDGSTSSQPLLIIANRMGWPLEQVYFQS